VSPPPCFSRFFAFFVPSAFFAALSSSSWLLASLTDVSSFDDDFFDVLLNVAG
jgi:hypothetical protein